MAKNTPPSTQQLVIYEVYVRNHGPNGTFADVEADLPRIKAMGVDVLWLMPIHPIGEANKKGALGCPYSIQNYLDVNPEYGTKSDFFKLIHSAHELGLKVMIDVVYNHTSHDSVLVFEHPDWFNQDEFGIPVSTVPDWSDVIDLKFTGNERLAAYLIEALQGWAAFGVDGFRCDVASLLPLDFWTRARYAVAQIKPGVIWLAESVYASFVYHRRFHGLTGLSDSELHQAFDITYDYDIWPVWQAAVDGKISPTRYLEMLRYQEAVLPAHAVKMRCVENHDQMRVMKLAPTPAQALAWTAFQAFNRGALMFYAGQESANTHTPSLFDSDKVDWGTYPLQPLLTRLAHLKKDPALKQGKLHFLAGEPAIQAAWQLNGANLYGVFNVSGASGPAAVQLPDGRYLDLLSDGMVEVAQGRLLLPESAFILRCPHTLELKTLVFDLLEYHHPE